MDAVSGQVPPLEQQLSQVLQQQQKGSAGALQSQKGNVLAATQQIKLLDAGMAPLEQQLLEVSSRRNHGLAQSQEQQQLEQLRQEQLAQQQRLQQHQAGATAACTAIRTTQPEAAATAAERQQQPLLLPPQRSDALLRQPEGVAIMRCSSQKQGNSRSSSDSWHGPLGVRQSPPCVSTL
jgi:hypothetical protein